MPGFSEIVGHEQIIDHLQNAIRLNKVSHAYILNGAERSGKLMLAEAFATALQCEQQMAVPCLECRSCRQAEGKNHPDIIYLTHEKPNTISVDDVRKQINDSVTVKPYSAQSKYKVYIIDEAEKMNEQAQNALLKTIEEPPAYVVILLLTTNADSFLQTIRSRCVILNLKAVSDEKIHRMLMQKYQVVDYKADVCTAFAQGNVGKAVMLAGSADFNELKDKTVWLVRKISEIEIYDLMQEVKAIGEYQKMDDFFDLLMMWYRDVLFYKAANTVRGIIFKEQIHEIARQAERSSYQGLNDILNMIEKTRRRLRSNVNQDISLELLLLNIKENIE